MKQIKFIILFVLTAGATCAEQVVTKRMSKAWRGNPKIEIDLQISSKWEIDGGMASDEKRRKRIEFSVSDAFSNSEVRDKTIIYRNNYDNEFEIIVTEEQNEAESGTGVMRGTVYGCYIVHNKKDFQLIHFFDKQGRPVMKSLFLEIIKNIKIRKVS
jgi:hypothetical protein